MQLKCKTSAKYREELHKESQQEINQTKNGKENKFCWTFKGCTPN